MTPTVRKVLATLVNIAVSALIMYVLEGLFSGNWGHVQIWTAVLFGITWGVFGDALTRFITRLFGAGKAEA